MATDFSINKSRTQTIREDIQGIDIMSKYVAVRRKVFVGEKMVSEVEFITTAQDIDSTPDIISINPVPSNRTMPKLYDKGIVEVIRTTPYSAINFDKFEQNNPFSVLQNHDMKNFMLLFRNNQAGSMSDVDGNPLPCAILFDGLSSGITSDIYNIRKVIYILRHRNDIKFLSDSDDDSMVTKAVPKDFFMSSSGTKPIETIIPFLWTPSESEDWRSYVAFCNEAESLDAIKREYVDDKAFILSNILGIDIARKDF